MLTRVANFFSNYVVNIWTALQPQFPSVFMLGYYFLLL